jgi:HPt (histidine-containing phosphotransfer) domain-containing protein
MRSPDTPVIDLEAIKSLRARATADAPEFFDEMVAIFIREIDRRRITMLEALERGDSDGLSRAAHSLGGSAKLFGAMPLAELCGELQVEPHPGAAQARALVKAIESECAEVRKFIIAESTGHS